MAIQLSIWERRDSGKMETMGKTAVEMCQILRKVKGITSSRFFWSGVGTMVFLIEGETAAINNLTQTVGPDYMRLAFVLADNARVTLSMQGADPKDALQTFRAAGRAK